MIDKKIKSLVVYYSLTDNTKFIAKLIGEELQSDIFQIHPEKDFKKKGIMKFVIGGKQVVKKETPDIKPFDKDLKDYELIFILTPVWVGTMAPAVRSFITKHKIKGKSIALVATCGDNEAKTFKDLKELLSGNKFIGEISFQRVNQNQGRVEEDTKKWLKTLVIE